MGRPSLAATRKALQEQTIKAPIIEKKDDRDTLIKIKEAVNKATTDFVAIADDDAVYASNWLEELLIPMTDTVGFVGGPCIPLIDETSSNAEKAIAEVTSNYFGTSNMSYRMKVNGKIRDADETNLLANGLYRREVFAKILNEEYDKIPPTGWETYVLTRIRQLGYRTVYNPQAGFKHHMRSNLFSFSRQIFRSGVGRMNFFKRFPKEMRGKFYMLGPSAFLVYLVSFFVLNWFNIYPLTGLPLIAYVLILMLVSYIPKHSSRFQALYYFTMHMSYGAGMIFGMVRNYRTWK